MVELYAHGWDLAKATGQQLRDSPELAAAALTAAQHIVRPEFRDGDAFGVEVAVGAGTSGIDRLAAFLGGKLSLAWKS